jgi:hypothetical protein
MRFALSAIAAGISLACACQFATAAPTITVSQLGTGNTAAAEQSGFATDADVVATITQTGNNNHVGGPGGTTAGILQHGPGDGAASTVTQTGNGNNAGILQGSIGIFSPLITIRQEGNANTGTVRQESISGTAVTLQQFGTGNVANIDQSSSADADIRVTQVGINNNASVVESGSGTYLGPRIEQDGEGNTVSAVVTNTSLGGHEINQSGLRNTSVTNQFNTFDSSISVRQVDTDNWANVSQTGDSQSAIIDQNGRNNLASIIQLGVFAGVGNTAQITQLGISNIAAIRQVGDGFSSAVSQVGTGNYTSVYQH